MDRDNGRSPSDQEVAQAWDAVRDFDDWELSLSRSQHVLDGLRVMEELSPQFAKLYDWAVVRWRTKALLTCDAPVVLLPNEPADAWRGVGLFTAGSVWFPIDRRTALVLLARSDGSRLAGHELQPPLGTSQQLNRSLVLTAHQRIYHHPDDALDAMLGVDFELPTPRASTCRCAIRSMTNGDDPSANDTSRRVEQVLGRCAAILLRSHRGLSGDRLFPADLSPPPAYVCSGVVEHDSKKVAIVELDVEDGKANILRPAYLSAGWDAS